MKTYILAFFSNTSIFISSIFIPLLAEELNATYLEIGIIIMTYGLASFFSYFIFGKLSDTSGRRKIFIMSGFLVCSIVFALQIFMKSIGTMLLIRGIAGLALGIYSFPLVAYIAVFNQYKRKVGTFSAFGALGMGFGTILAGILKNYDVIFLSSSIFFLACFVFSLFLPDIRQKKMKVALFPFNIVKKNLQIYLAFFIRHTGAQSVWVIFPLFLLSVGADKFLVGLLYGISAMTQFLAMHFIGRACEKRNEIMFIRIGTFLSSLVFLSCSLISVWYLLIPVQVMLGLAWSSMYIGSLVYLIDKNIEKATATGLLGSAISLSAVIGPLLGGLISYLFGFQLLFLFSFALCILSLVIMKY
jgi:MFS family permease